MDERRGQASAYPLTADLAGVLAAARHERAPAHGLDGASRGVGAAVLRFAIGLADRIVVRRAQRMNGGSPVSNSRISA